MNYQLDAVNREIQQENNRHRRCINDLNKKKIYENTMHQQRMYMLNNRKEQIKKIYTKF